MRLGALRDTSGGWQERATCLTAVIVLGTSDAGQSRQSGSEEFVVHIPSLTAAFWLDHITEACVQLVVSAIRIIDNSFGWVPESSNEGGLGWTDTNARELVNWPDSGTRIQSRDISHLPASQLKSILPIDIDRLLERDLEVAHANALGLILVVHAIAVLEIVRAYLGAASAQLADGVERAISKHVDHLGLHVRHTAASVVLQAGFGLHQNLALTIHLSIRDRVRVGILGEYGHRREANVELAQVACLLAVIILLTLSGRSLTRGSADGRRQ